MKKMVTLVLFALIMTSISFAQISNAEPDSEATILNRPQGKPMASDSRATPFWTGRFWKWFSIILGSD